MSETDPLPPNDAVPAHPADLPQVDGYEILGLLGEGPLGCVWRAVQSSSGQLTALKLFTVGDVGDGAHRAHLERDLDVARTVAHPQVAGLREAGWRGAHFIHAAELIEGEPIDHYATNRALPAREALLLMHQVCLAVQAGHERGLLHLHLKPTNVLVTEDGLPHVLDFGLGRLCGALDEAELTEAEGAAAALACLAPEQLTAEAGVLDTRTDVYALGAMLYRLLTGEWPPVADTGVPVSFVGLPLDPDLAAVVSRAVALDSGDRYATAGELADDLARYLNQDPVVAIQPTSSYYARKWVRQSGLLIPLLVVLAVLVTGWVGWNLLRLTAERNQATRDVDELREQLSRTREALRREQASVVRLTEPVVDMTKLPEPLPPAAAEPVEATTRALDVVAGLLAELEYDAAERHLWEIAPAERGAEWGRLLRFCHNDLWTWRGAPGPVGVVTVSADGRLLLTAGGDGVAQLWSLATTKLQRELRGHAGPVLAAAMTSDSRRVATVAADRTARLWDTTTGRWQTVATFRGGRLGAAGFTADGTQLRVVGNEPLTLVAVDVASGSELWQRELLAVPVSGVAVARNGQRVIAGRRDGRTHIWEARDGTALWELRETRGAVTAVGLSADGRVAAVGRDDGVTTLWNVESGRELMSVAGHVGAVLAVAFAPDGNTVVTTGADRTARLWDVASGRLVVTWRGHGSEVTAAAVVGDGQRLVTGGADGAARLWGMQPPPELLTCADEAACRELLGSLTREEVERRKLARYLATLPRTR